MIAAGLTIARYELPRHGRREVAVPAGATVLHVGVCRDDVCVWIASPRAAATAAKVFHVATGDGDAVPPVPVRFVGTAVLYDGELACHVFEELP